MMTKCFKHFQIYWNNQNQENHQNCQNHQNLYLSAVYEDILGQEIHINDNEINFHCLPGMWPELKSPTRALEAIACSNKLCYNRFILLYFWDVSFLGGKIFGMTHFLDVFFVSFGGNLCLLPAMHSPQFHNVFGLLHFWDVSLWGVLFLRCFIF